jgi:hypothetical protein
MPMEIDEIDDLSPSYSIYEITYGATENEGEGNSSIELFALQATY